MNDPHEHPKTVDWPPKDTDWSGSDEDTLAPGDDASGDSGQLSKIGRYRVIKTIGQGGFGRVYLAHDDELDRPVAIKVPRRDRLTDVADVEEYLTEARTLASLDHASIVPVYDVGRTDDGLCFVVSKYVEGSDLAARIEANRPSHSEAAEFVATVAEALHYAHTQGLVHRDIKPANILLDNQGRPYVADFGLALKEADFGKGAGFAGTPAYMSPEQARAEGHRVDGRSDVFSLGVVFYELLTGRKPFHGDSIREILDHISSVEARPPRQIEDRIPKELERICLKALSKRATDRYTTAQDLADDLRHFLKKTVEDTTAPQAEAVAPSAEAGIDSNDFDSSDKPPVKIVPKGLRSFDAHDADFFLELLPGPRDREGLPDSLRFWKTRIEEADPDNTFSVGLIYGPSGCGKSSLVKAGLLPRLSEDVIPVYVETTPEETEAGLLHGLRKRCPAVEDNLNLKDTLAALRRGQGIPTGKKVLIVLDQFEQWLHAKKEEENSELVQALRQCDGGRVQCIVMVRDDFWLTVSRFLREIEVRLLEGHNIALADLFDLDHARKVLAAFGRAFGKLPENTKDTTNEQEEFVKQSVSGLAEEGKVICVRLALFADMMKGKSWTPSTLKKVGGTKGIGATFLEETFSSSTASPEHRYHQKAARAVLKALLPKSGRDIKGEMKSYDELLEASGYTHRVKDFDDLIRILDSEIRLITPSDPEGVESEDDSVSQVEASQKYYQLTHDYLVPSLREWLTRKQKETRRGRAELRLAEHASLWNAKPDKSRLPSLFGYLNMRLYTDKSKWTGPQRKMMGKSARMHGLRWGSVLLVLVVVTIIVQQIASSVQRRNTLERTQTAVAAMSNSRGILVPHAIEDLEAFPRDMVVEELESRFADSDESQKLPLAYALAHFGDVKVQFLVEQIRHAATDEVDNLVAALGRSKEDSLKSMRAAANRADSEEDWRHKARLAIVALRLDDPTSGEEMCKDRPDPIQRTIFIETLAKWHGDLTELAMLADDIDSGLLRYGIALGIGSIGADQVTPSEKRTWQRVLADWNQNEPDTGTHNAADWALRQWNLELPQIAASNRPLDGTEWHINGVGMTMLRIPAGSFQRGEQQVTLTRSFLLADREVSVGQFQQFVDDPEYPAEEKPENWRGADEQYSPTANHPVNNVNWYDAVMFCNWLSRREGLTPCYERTGERDKDYKGELTEYDAWRLVGDANGYRLLTEAEWEYACRAGSVTTYCYGDDESLLDRYAVYRASRTDPCGNKLPNVWGLFDMHGNLREWCQDWYDSYADEKEIADPMGPEKGSSRVLRGGSFTNLARYVRSANRDLLQPDIRLFLNGFRVARTYP